MRLLIPPFPVIVRNLRPFVNYAIVLLWICVRFGLPSSSRDAAQLHSFHHVESTYDSCFLSSANQDHDHMSTKWWEQGLLNLFISIILRVESFFLLRLHEQHYEKLFYILRVILNLFHDILGIILMTNLFSIVNSMQRTSLPEMKDQLTSYMFNMAVEYIGSVRKQLIKEERKMEAFLSESLKDKTWSVTRSLPDQGIPLEQILSTLEKKSSEENQRWIKGLVSGSVYCGEPGHTNFLNKVYALYSLSNPLHTDLWPSISQMEAEIISMTAHLLGGDEKIVGATTSGGTESIILTVRAHLHEYGWKRGIRYPEIICSTTAHAALEKACDMFQIRLLKIPCDSVSFQLLPFMVEKYISSNTILIYASAPCYPQGVIDPIEALSTLALKYNIGLHVDCCLGGFILPFARKLSGYDIPPFDFNCPGVTSISTDTHKYGYAHKGSSVILYRNKTLRRAQYFTYGKWTGGLYSTSTILGSRPGALIACAWSSMIAMGDAGYKARTQLILEATASIAEQIELIPGLYLMGGKPKAMIVCFSSTVFNIYRVADFMTKRGWSLNSLQKPACIHLCVTLLTAQNVDKFIHDLRDVVSSFKLDDGESRKTDGSAAIYGMAGSMPAGPVNELLKVYNDVVLSC